MKLPAALMFLTLLAVPLSAQQPTPSGCDAAQYRQFDFWVGEWEVVDTAGAVLGRNIIRSVHGGCVLHEQWTGVSGSTGESFNIYDRTIGQWHQTWVDNTGTLLQLDGGVEGGAMVLRGRVRGADGAPQQQRITWTPRPDGALVQHWESSADGAIWLTVFRGTYRRLPP